MDDGFYVPNLPDGMAAFPQIGLRCSSTILLQVLPSPSLVLGRSKLKYNKIGLSIVFKSPNSKYDELNRIMGISSLIEGGRWEPSGLDPAPLALFLATICPSSVKV